MEQKTEQEINEHRSDDAMSPSDIQALVDGLDPINWVQLRLTASLPPRKRLLAGMQAQAFARATVRGTLRRRYPDLSQAELNMKVLAHLTTMRMEKLLTED